jgi:hypothetical protein
MSRAALTFLLVLFAIAAVVGYLALCNGRRRRRGRHPYPRHLVSSRRLLGGHVIPAS